MNSRAIWETIALVCALFGFPNEGCCSYKHLSNELHSPCIRRINCTRLRLVQLHFLLMHGPCNYFPNCTRIHVITYTNSKNIEGCKDGSAKNHMNYLWQCASKTDHGKTTQVTPSLHLYFYFFNCTMLFSFIS